MLCQWTISRSGKCSILRNLLWWHPSCQCFYITWSYLCFLVCERIYMRAACWCLSWRAMETHLVQCDLMSPTHRLSVCLCFLGWQCAYCITVYLFCYCSAYIWFRVAHRQGCTVAKNHSTHKLEAHGHSQKNDFLQSLFPTFVLWASLTSSSHTSTHPHKHTHINSPLGMCCFHYLQLGPETAFWVEWSTAEQSWPGLQYI